MIRRYIYALMVTAWLAGINNAAEEKKADWNAQTLKQPLGRMRFS